MGGTPVYADTFTALTLRVLCVSEHLEVYHLMHVGNQEV